MVTRRALLSSPLLALPLQAAPAAPVAIQRSRTYGPGLENVMRRLFDGIGGLERLVKNKSVVMKVNLTGPPGQRLLLAPAELAHWTHPRVIGMTSYLLHRAGARRITIVESPWSSTDPLEDHMVAANWNPSLILNAGGPISFLNTNYLAGAKAYARFPVPTGGHLFPAFDLHPIFRDSDVLVSLAKLKEHSATGISLSLQNLLGITPCTIYGDGAGEKEPSLAPRGCRGAVFHSGKRGPSKSAPQELHPNSPRHEGYRIPRVVADLNAARPIDLAIIDGVESLAGGEGPWIKNNLRRCRPGVLIAGANAVCTDAVAAAVMGFNPMAGRGTAPFETCDNTVELAEQHGIGTRDLNRIEVAGFSISDALYSFRKA